MDDNDTARPVVVGYDGSGEGDAALDWAQAEARRRESPLVMLVASGIPYLAAPEMSAASPWRDEVTAKLVDEAKSYAAKATGVDVSVESPLRSPAASLVEASADAELVVIGRHARSAIGEAFWGSTSAQVAAHASCPVVVVDRPVGGDSAAPVVVAVDGSDHGRAALGFAFQRSAELDAPLVAVHAWWLDVSDHLADSWLPDDLVEGVENGAQAVLDESLAPWIEKFPDVVVRKILVRQYPVEAVLNAAGDAQVIVVGSRGRGGFAGLLLGSVSQGLLHDTARVCPLVVVHTAD